VTQAAPLDTLSPRKRTTAGTYAKRGAFTFSGDLVEELRRAAGQSWPNDRYRNDPVGFVEDVLGDRPWGKQIEILEAVARHDHVAIKSGHKIGKSRVDVWLALWWFCTRPDARVLFTSSVERQVDSVLWRELVLVLRRSPIKLDARPAEHAKTGMRAPDLREIVGLSAREAEAVAGTSGTAVLYLVDEASGCSETLFAAFEGNLAGGGKLVMTSNPTRTTGYFFDAFKEEKQVDNGGTWKTISIASTETPNVVAGQMIVPGLATREWCEARKAAWGEDSLDYKVRVLGEFPTHEERRILTLHLVIEATRRWDEAQGVGRLVVGIDPAGPAGGGDESGFASRRGAKILGVLRRRGLSAAGHLEVLLGIIAEAATPGEVPVVNVDADGPVGSLVADALEAHAWSFPKGAEPFHVVRVRGSQKAEREPDKYERTRDELFANVERWIREGGAIPQDDKLQSELHAPDWQETISGKLKATPKDDMRRMLGRSPDTLDAVALACWSVDAFAERVAEVRAAVSREHKAEETRRVPRMDPWAAERTWRR
jgi:phage terminase large subunit